MMAESIPQATAKRYSTAFPPIRQYRYGSNPRAGAPRCCAQKRFRSASARQGSGAAAYISIRWQVEGMAPSGTYFLISSRDCPKSPTGKARRSRRGMDVILWLRPRATICIVHPMADGTKELPAAGIRIPERDAAGGAVIAVVGHERQKDDLASVGTEGIGVALAGHDVGGP